jgi:ubiquitin C-terminal hydrolase
VAPDFYARRPLPSPSRLPGFDSNGYEPFLDLSLDVGGRLCSVERSLAAFAAVETLDAANAWKCPRCAQKVRAEKRMTVERAPPLLTIHLKRFSFLAHNPKLLLMSQLRDAVGRGGEGAGRASAKAC